MPETPEFLRALEIEREMIRLMDQIADSHDAVLIAQLNRRLDLLTRELAEIQATTLATAA